MRIHFRDIIDPLTKRHSNGVSLAGRYWRSMLCILDNLIALVDGEASIAGNTGAKTIKLEKNVSPFFYFIFWCKGGASHGSKRKILWASRMRGSRGSLSIYNKKKPVWQRFFFQTYFTEVQWFMSKKTIIFQGSIGETSISREGGSIGLFPIETYIICNFPGGSGPPAPTPPLDPHRVGWQINCNLQHIYTVKYGLFHSGQF